MTYISAPPQLIRNWGSDRTYEANALIQKQDGGYEERGSGAAINIVSDRISLNVVVRGADYIAIASFIAERDGSPFWFEGKLYRVISEQWTWTGVQTWQLSLDLKEAKR